MIKKEDITVLYVDDEDPNLFIFKATFGREYQVLTATSGEQGLEKLAEAYNDIIVVISDMNMPGMTGVEFIKTARVTYPKVGYFILTGYGFNDEIDQALNQNIVNRFFTKPFDQQAIEQAIEEFRDIKIDA